ncbi:MAG: hypothetical protein RL150_394 [Candidatus Parcubacteria bacterium]|jgi:hypothetical protein
MKYVTTHYLYAIILLILFGYAYVADAAELSIETSSVEPYTGDEIVVTIFAQSEEPLNAAGATLTYPHDKLELKEIRDGGSRIHFWIQKEEVEPGAFTFSGITTGGFSGPKSNLISLVFVVREPGEIPLTLRDASLLRNDGEASNALTMVRNKILTSNPGEDNREVQYTVDEEIPEYFAPEIVRNETIHDGAPVLVFATQDKGSGMSHYEVREGWFAFFKPAESPYILEDAKLRKTIYVKAVDLHGNERIVMLPATNPLPAWWYAVYILGTFAVIAAILYVVRNLWRVWQKR